MLCQESGLPTRFQSLLLMGGSVKPAVIILMSGTITALLAGPIFFFNFDGYLFVDGAFWHGHPDYFRFGRSGKFWDDKIRRNIERDRFVNAEVNRVGGRLMRVWDFEVVDCGLGVATRRKIIKFSMGNNYEKKEQIK